MNNNNETPIRKEALKEAHLQMNIAISAWEAARMAFVRAGEDSYVSGATTALREMLNVSGQFEEAFEESLDT